MSPETDGNVLLASKVPASILDVNLAAMSDTAAPADVLGVVNSGEHTLSLYAYCLCLQTVLVMQ